MNEKSCAARLWSGLESFEWKVFQSERLTMKSVGILTFHRALNCGAVLQAFALQRAVINLGHPCTIIDYLRQLRDDPYCLFHFPRNRATVKHDLLVVLNLWPHLAVRKRFQDFRTKHLILTNEHYRDFDAIVRRCPAFEAYVTGSDQVWHPNQLREGHGRVFYLDFARGSRIAYAPSFGVSQLPVEYHAQVSICCAVLIFSPRARISGACWFTI